MTQPINLAEKFAAFSDVYSPKVVAEMNDYQFKLAKLEGEFIWHSHDDTDETFIVLDGQLDIQLPDRTVSLKAGELFVIPKGMQHKPVAHSLCQVMLIEPKGVVNTGKAGGELTAKDDVWI